MPRRSRDEGGDKPHNEKAGEKRQVTKCLPPRLGDCSDLAENMRPELQPGPRHSEAHSRGRHSTQAEPAGLRHRPEANELSWERLVGGGPFLAET